MYPARAMSSGLGVNITPDLVNDFFSIKPKGQTPLKYVKHHVATTGTMSARTGSSGGITPGNAFNINDVQYFEQQLKLGCVDESEDEVVEDVNEFLLPEPIDNDEYKSAPQEMSTEIYDNYSFAHTYDATLPITDEQEHIIQTIEANRVTVIQGSTGSGKTTQVPQYILDHYQQKGKFCNILVTQPRKIAAISVAKRVSQERNWPVSTLVGYQVARDRQVSEDTRITYLTTGVLLQKLIKNKHLNDYTHVILDEVHERDQDVDFSMLVVRYYLKTVSKHVKVVLMSATVDCSLFSNYFSILINNRKEGAPVISVEGKMYDVTEYYFEDLSSDAPQQTIYEPEISDKSYKICRELIMALDNDERKGNNEQGHLAENRGTVLCFLPGVPEIKKMQRYIADIETKYKLNIMPLHSKISNHEQVHVFYPARKGERKVILSTNIAESSVTVPDIKYVIDFCLTKEMETDRDTKYQRLVLKWASKASLIQRRGRAGRVSEGHCFRLISKHFYDEFDEYAVPEMLRAPLEQLILQVKLLELGPSPSMVLQLALQPPRVSSIKSTILLLKEVGALTIRQNGKINNLDGDITFLGRVLGSLPVDVHIGKLLLMGYTFGVLEECLIIAACLSLKSIFTNFFGSDGELKTYTKKMNWSEKSFCDMLASLNAFLSWKNKKMHTGFGEPEKQWAKKSGVEWKRFKEVDELVEDLRRRLQDRNIQTHRNIYMREMLEKDDELVLKLVIAGAFYPHYFHSYEIDEAEATKTMCGLDPCTTVVIHGAPNTLHYYKTKVAQLFIKCGTGKKLHFDNSRVFIEFQNSQDPDCTIAPQVYLALKMRHLVMRLDLHVSKKRDEALRLAEKDRKEVHNPETGLRTVRVHTKLDSDETKLSVICDSRQVRLQESGYINIFIQEIISPSHFWATYANPETKNLMHQLNSKINCHSGKNLSVLEEEDIKVGMFCLAPFEGEFFRAEIKSVAQSLVTCFFVDFGNTVQIADRRLIRRCPSFLADYSYQAFECFLSEIKPVQGTWSVEAMIEFSERCPIGTMEFVGKIYSQIHNSYRLDLFVDDTSINRFLIEKGYAVHVEEPLLSKNRHEEMSKLEYSFSDNVTTHTFVEDVTEAPNYDEEVLKISLRGPFSSFEMSFSCLTQQGRQYCTRIERDSVNSVLVSDMSQATSIRFLVAATITMNPSGNVMNARDTCLLPNIRGLTSLLTLLFAPEAELRCDKKETHLTGALCGLGCDDNGESILPEYDIEIPFDVKFGENDLMLINSIRYLINEAIGIDLEKIEHAPNKIAVIQEYARTKLLELINTPRQNMEPKTYRREYHWKQLKEGSLLDCGHKEKPTHLYVYHKGIFFNEQEHVDPRKMELRKQIEDFHKMAGESLLPFTSEVVCPLCQVICRHPRGLFLHCETRIHQNWASTLFKDS